MDIRQQVQQMMPPGMPGQFMPGFDMPPEMMYAGAMWDPSLMQPPGFG